MTFLSFYRQQAAKEQEAADAAVLENVRNRSRRAAEAWMKLASQIEYADELRATRNVPVKANTHLGEPNESQDRGQVVDPADMAFPFKSWLRVMGGETGG